MSDKTAALTIEQFPEQIAVVRLGPGAMIPEWAESSSVFSITATSSETTVVCAARSVPTKARHERSFVAFRANDVAFEDATATTVALLNPLLAAGIGALSQPTFDAPWILVRKPQADAAAEEWRRAGHTVTIATPA